MGVLGAEYVNRTVEGFGSQLSHGPTQLARKIHRRLAGVVQSFDLA
jgi:hypothetical protein